MESYTLQSPSSYSTTWIVSGSSVVLVWFHQTVLSRICPWQCVSKASVSQRKPHFSKKTLCLSLRVHVEMLVLYKIVYCVISSIVPHKRATKLCQNTDLHRQCPLQPSCNTLPVIFPWSALCVYRRLRPWFPSWWQSLITTCRGLVYGATGSDSSGCK